MLKDYSAASGGKVLLSCLIHHSASISLTIPVPLPLLGSVFSPTPEKLVFPRAHRWPPFLLLAHCFTLIGKTMSLQAHKSSQPVTLSFRPDPHTLLLVFNQAQLRADFWFSHSSMPVHFLFPQPTSYIFYLYIHPLRYNSNVTSSAPTDCIHSVWGGQREFHK